MISFMITSNYQFIMKTVKIAWYGIHEGEEPPLLPAGGIFFSGCNLHCVFCQNFQISQQGIGKIFSVLELANIMIELENKGANCIDLVTPTIWHAPIKEAIILAKSFGLKIPIVWNSNGYEKLDIIKSLAGLIDIYLPDFKYSDDDLAFKYSGIKNYLEVATSAIKEMYMQVGNLQIKNTVAQKGIIIRHLVLPNNLPNSFGVLRAIANIDIKIHISLMNQYFPTHNSKQFSELAQIVTDVDFEKVCDLLVELGFKNGWIQGEKSTENLIPDFTKPEPFKNAPA